jgi:transcriptional regulator GlxA family with amidase domain
LGEDGKQTKDGNKYSWFCARLKLDSGFFSIHPVSLQGNKSNDLLIIPSVNYDENLIEDNAELIKWIKEQYNTGAEIATICSGAFLLAATGLIDGKTCSTHWNVAANFRRLFPGIHLEIDKLITVERGIYTNGGAYSFLNLILFLVEKYFGRETLSIAQKFFKLIWQEHRNHLFLFSRLRRIMAMKWFARHKLILKKTLPKKFLLKNLPPNWQPGGEILTVVL